MPNDMLYTCKCGKVYADDWDLIDHQQDDSECPFVRCDDANCRVLKDPRTLEELREAVHHWRKHRLYGGCSHGC